MFAVIAAAVACHAAALLAQVAAATGGAAQWKSVGEISARGALSSSGFHGVAELHDDVRGGRYASRSTLPVVGTTIQVYDGTNVWVRDISGGIHAYDSWYPRARALTQVYLTRRAYLKPAIDAAITCAGSATNGSQRMELLRVAPRGGIAAVLAVDRQTHLLDSISIRTPITTDVTRFGDYRQTGALVLPYSISLGSAFEPENADRIAVRRYDVSRAVNAEDFAKPAALPNARMAGNARSTSVPIVLEGHQLLVWASINGRAALPFIVDTGGHAILDSVAAKMLGVRSYGSGVSGGAGSGTIALRYARVRSMRIGDAQLFDQPMLVIPYSYDFYERGRRVPLAGILGLEWFERYAVRIDYAGKRMTLAPLATFRYRGRAARVPIRFQEDMPLAPALADGNRGDFGVDTGNAGFLILYGDYLRRTGLLTKYAAGQIVRGQGTGGGNTGTIQTLGSFSIGGHAIPNLAADFTQMKTGSFASWTEAGDLGLTVLSHFTPTFDYANETLYLEPLAQPLAIAPNRSGLSFAKNEPKAIDVVAVRPNSAASAAGIAAGDRIVAVNGKDAENFSRADFVELVTAPAGTQLKLTVARGSSTRNVTLILR
jgi:PDZ domain-containing protein/aspartyl protease